MNFELSTLDLGVTSHDKYDVLAVLWSRTFKPGKDALSALIQQAVKAGDLDAKPANPLLLHRPAQLGATRVVLVDVADGSAKEVRRAVGAAFAAVSIAKPQKMAVCFLLSPQPGAVQAALTALADASYVYTTTKPAATSRSLKRVMLSLPDAASYKSEFEQACATVAGIEEAKEWANRPANHATPTHLGEAAKALAKRAHIKCEVLGPKEVAQLGMGSFMAVAQGSAQPLRFIVLRYQGAAKSVAPTVLVGKGITFDSGGISIKPAAEMDEMKFDMCGAASVLGVFKALGELQPKVNVVGLIPSCENLLSSKAVKPGDVVTSMSGQTIEILNTDAEGRLILCDALTYAERFKPAAVIDIATLTGACMIALGQVRSGLFSADEALAHALQAAGEASLDLCWRLPLDDEYAEGLKTHFADVANVAGRLGGAITAAKFLQRFAQKYRWAHLDIAGTAWKSGAAKGATGRPVGLLINYLLGLKASK